VCGVCVCVCATMSKTHQDCKVKKGQDSKYSMSEKWELPIGPNILAN
jgi:hypothetical protein